MKGYLTAALDGRGIGPREHTILSFRVEETWYVQKAGPNYVNTFRITEFDDRDLPRLHELETHDSLERTEQS